MAGSLISQLLDKMRKQGEEFQTALVDVVNGYKDNQKDSKFISAIEGFIAHISRDAELGSIIGFYQFESSVDIPSEFKSFLNIAKLHELQVARSPSTLVADVENTIAASNTKAKTTFEQTLRLEKALLGKKVALRHQEEVEAKIEELAVDLYSCFADLIIESNDLPDLKAKIESEFFDPELKNKTYSGQFFHEVECQMEFLDSKQECLKDKSFFECYFQDSNMANRYELICDYYQDIKALGAMTVEHKATMSHLLNKVEDRVFKEIDHEKFRLMSVRGATVDKVFAQLEKTAQKAWEIYQDTPFFVCLTNRIELEKENYKDWEKLRVLEDQLPSSAPKPLMYQLHCMKFISQDPTGSDVKQRLAALESPQKPKTTTTRSLSAPVPVSLFDLYVEEVPVKIEETAPKANSGTPGDSTRLSSLLCTETLALPETEDSTPKVKKRKLS